MLCWLRLGTAWGQACYDSWVVPLRGRGRKRVRESTCCTLYVFHRSPPLAEPTAPPSAGCPRCAAGNGTLGSGSQGSDRPYGRIHQREATTVDLKAGGAPGKPAALRLRHSAAVALFCRLQPAGHWGLLWHGGFSPHLRLPPQAPLLSLAPGRSGLPESPGVPASATAPHRRSSAMLAILTEEAMGIISHLPDNSLRHRPPPGGGPERDAFTPPCVQVHMRIMCADAMRTGAVSPPPFLHLPPGSGASSYRPSCCGPPGPVPGVYCLRG